MRLKSSITAAWKRYNANSKDVNTGDCVKRSISLAYGIDYDEVARGLNDLKRKLGLDRFNIYPVYNRYIMTLGVSQYGNIKSFGFDSNVTVDGFTEAYPDGTYIIICGENPGRTTHMVCIIDGDYWDSWNSGKWYVDYIYCVHEGRTSMQSLDIEAACDEIELLAQDCIDKSAKKMPYATFDLGDMYVNNKFTAEQNIICRIDLDKLGIAYTGASVRKALYTYVIKLNPKLSQEENIESLKKKLWVKIREWAYSVRKYAEEAAKLEKAKPHKNFLGDRNILAKMPEWAIPRITWIHDNGSDPYGYRYEMDVETLPDDPRYNLDNGYVRIEGDNVTELRKYLEAYRKNYARQDWGDF